MAPINFLETVHSLAKRGGDDIGGVPKWLLVFLIMLAAGAFVVLVYGLARFMLPEKEGMRQMTAEQADYMREVRARNLNNLMAESAHRGPPHYRRSNNTYAEGSKS